MRPLKSAKEMRNYWDLVEAMLSGICANIQRWQMSLFADVLVGDYIICLSG